MTDPKSGPDAGSSHAEVHTRIAAVQVRLSRLDNVETRLRKLNIAMADLATSDRPKQLKLIRSARSYVETIKAEPVQGIVGFLRVMDNELVSLSEGIHARSVTAADLVLTSGVSSINEVRSLKAKATERLTKLQSELTANGEYDGTEYEINLNQSELEQIPEFGHKDFLLHRAPVVFSGTNSSDSKFSKVGYVSVEKLDQLGFNAATIGGYTVVKKQLCIGVNPKTLSTAVLNSDGEPMVDEHQRPVMRQLTIKDTKQVSQGGKPKTVNVKRPKTAMDEAKKVVKLLEGKTGYGWEFISAKPKGFKGGIWFWVMPEKDVRRFGKAFPSGRIDVSTWGFAGERL